MTTTIKLPESSAELLVKRAAIAIRRAAAHGLPSPRVTIGERWIEDVHFYDALAQIRGAQSDYRSRGCRMATVIVDDHEPPAGEWLFVGHREMSSSLSDGIRTKNVSSFGKVPPGSERRDLCCDHCGHRRERKLSFVLEHISNGKLVEVGTNCVEAFTGSSVSSGFLAGLREHRRILASLENAELREGDIREEDMIDEVRTVLAVACSVLSRSSYVNSSQAESLGCEATWRLVYAEMARYRQPGTTAEEIYVTAEDFLRADDIEQFFMSENLVPSDFRSRVRTVMAKGISGRLDIATIVSAAASYETSLKRSSRRRELDRVAARSTHLGEKGDRFDFLGRVFFIHGYTSEYGEGSVVVMTDENDHLLTWVTSSTHGLEVGNEYLMKGTVSRHTYRDHGGISAQETRVGRVKVLRQMGAFNTVTELEMEAEGSDAASKELEDVFGSSFSF